MQECVQVLLDDDMTAIATDGDPGVGREDYETAYRHAEATGNTAAMATAVLGLGGLWVHEHRTAEMSVRYEFRLRYVLSLLDPASPLGLRLRIRLAAEIDYRTGKSHGVLALLHEARRAGDPFAVADAANLAHHCLSGPDHGELRQQLATELIEQSYATGRRGDLLMGVLRQAMDACSEGGLLVQRRLDELRGLLADRPHRVVRYVLRVIDVMLVIREGHLDKAEQMATEAYRYGIDDVHAMSWYGAHLVTIRWYQGRLTELLPLLTKYAHSAALSVHDNSFQAALAVAAATIGDHRTAASSIAALCGDDLARLPRTSTWFATMYGIAQAAALINDRVAAAQVGKLLAPYADRPMIGGLGAVCLGSAHHTLGIVALTMGDPDGAVHHLRLAVRRNLALGHWPAVVLSRRWLAQALETRGRPDDAGAARTERATATREATELGFLGTETAPRNTARCVRQGRHWEVRIGSRHVVVDHGVGMLYLAVLIANPRRDIRAIDLVAGATAAEEANGESVARSAGSEHPVLDNRALQNYRDRMTSLDRQIEDLGCRDETGRLARIQAERDWLAGEIASATGIGGRVRAFSDERERARIAVGKAIRRAISRITLADPLIGDHLRQTVHTGANCSYLP